MQLARARNIKPGFYKNAELVECSVWARLVFPGLWMLADREGRLEDRPKQIKMELLPSDPQDMELLLQELAAHGFIHRYELDGIRCIQVLNFNKHQNPPVKEPPSMLPTLTEPGASPVQARCLKRSRTGVTGLIPDSGFLIPSSLIPDSLIPSPLNGEVSPDPSRATRVPAGKRPAVGVETWNCYAKAYAAKYGVDPVRNRKVNSQISQLVERLGGAESPLVAEYYLTHRHSLYVSAKHCVDLLVRDCEKLRTEWATGTQGTHTQAVMGDRTQTNYNSFAPLIAAARKKEAEEAANANK